METAPVLSDEAPVLAAAADVLSDQLRAHLGRLAQLISPHAATLERRFNARLRALRFNPRQRTALSGITPGAIARVIVRGKRPLGFFEQVEYNGRRLAKLNLPPSAVAGALEEYDLLLSPVLRKLMPSEFANFHWVREQLHFCVVLTLNNAYYQVREAETKAFYDLFRVELESHNLDELLRRFLITLSEFCRADAAHLVLLDQEGGLWQHRASVVNGEPRGASLPPLPNEAVLMRMLALPRCWDPRSGRQTPALVDPHWKAAFASCWSVPLVAGSRLAGVIQFGFRKPYEWLPREQELLAAAAERCLMAAEKARLIEDLAAREEQVRRLAEHMLHVEEAERRRISRELHDEAGQSMLCIRLQMEMIEQSLPESEAVAKAKLGEVRDVTERTIVEIRRLIAALSPAVLDQIGLEAALRQLVTRFRRMHPARVKLQFTRLQRLPKKIESIVYRLVQECCNNIAKHSSASRVNISLSSADGILRLHVEDDGVGFQVEEALKKTDSFGLAGMRERVALLGGKFEIESRRRVQQSDPQGCTDRESSRVLDAEAGKNGVMRNGPERSARVSIPTAKIQMGKSPMGIASKGTAAKSALKVGAYGTAIRIELPLPEHPDTTSASAVFPARTINLAGGAAGSNTPRTKRGSPAERSR